MHEHGREHAQIPSRSRHMCEVDRRPDIGARGPQQAVNGDVGGNDRRADFLGLREVPEDVQRRLWRRLVRSIMLHACRERFEMFVCRGSCAPSRLVLFHFRVDFVCGETEIDGCCGGDAEERRAENTDRWEMQVLWLLMLLLLGGLPGSGWSCVDVSSGCETMGSELKPQTDREGMAHDSARI